MKVVLAFLVLGLVVLPELIGASAPSCDKGLGWKPTEASRAWQKKYLATRYKDKQPASIDDLPTAFDSRFERLSCSLGPTQSSTSLAGNNGQAACTPFVIRANVAGRDSFPIFAGGGWERISSTAF